MKRRFFIAILLTTAAALAVFIGISAVSYAQEAVATGSAAAPQADLQEAYGEVVSVDQKAGAITITEYDYEKDEDVNKTYKLDKMATYENVKSLAEIKQGDWTALTLKTQKDGPAVVTSVYVERYDLEEEVPAAAAPVVTAPPAATTPPQAAPAPTVANQPVPEEPAPQQPSVE